MSSVPAHVYDQELAHGARSVTAAAPILEIRNVTRQFGGVTAVRGASLEVLPGTVTSLIGPNGAGKTTLFNTVTGTIPASEGEILLRSCSAEKITKSPSVNAHVTNAESGAREHRIEKMRPDQIARLGVARTFQNIRLFASLTVLDNVKIGFHPRTRSRVFGALLRDPRTRREERAVESAALSCLRFCGLDGLADEFAGSLPYGYQRRLEIARALATGPSLLLLDEPAAGMNPSESRDLLELVRKIVGSGITVFLIEHDMRVVMNVSDKIYVLDRGEVIAQGTPKCICDDARVVEAYLGKAEH